MALVDHVIHLENGKMAPDTAAAEVQQLACQAAASSAVVIHFHGGLVDEASGRATAARLYPVYARAGAFPVFFVWESGLLETLRNNFSEIADERIFRIMWKRISAIVQRKRGQDGASRAVGVLPPTDTTAHERAIDASLARSDGEDTVDQLAAAQPSTRGVAPLAESEQFALEQELLLDPELEQEARAVSNGLRHPEDISRDLSRSPTTVRASSATLMDPLALESLVDRPQPGSRGLLSTAKLVSSIVAVAARVLSRMARARDHGWHATIIEEILRAYYVANAGALVWNLMKQDTADCFKPGPRVFGGTCFLEALNAAAPASPLPRIVLVGHSTGAIYISEFIDKACAVLPATAGFTVIFLAAASRFDKTAATLAAHSGRIRNIRSFGMQDDVEKRDRLVPVLYPHSLLYFVSGVVEGGEDVPLVGMQRFHDAGHFPPRDFPEIDTVRCHLDARPDRLVWSVTAAGAGPGLGSASTRHGDFDNDPLTLASLGEMIRGGF